MTTRAVKTAFAFVSLLAMIWIGDADAFAQTVSGDVSQGIAVSSSNDKIERVFAWATKKALSYVQTGKAGPVDKHERSEGQGHVKYMPSYWAGYTSRSAFYSRDFCHQASGAHLLGLDTENLAMLKAFAESATEGRKWFPLWAFNFDGSPFRLDYRDDTWFVREVPAVFELVEQCYRLYMWTGDREYLDDSVLRQFCARAVSDFISLHDGRIPNGVAEGDGSGQIFLGSATYNEIESDSPLIESGDGIACQYQALLSYSKMLAMRGEAELAKTYAKKADRLKTLFNTEWGVKKSKGRYVRGYDVKGKANTNWGLENSWFMPMKLITEPSEKNDAYLDYIARCMDSRHGRPSNLEAVSYVPGVFFPYNRVADAWKWLEYIMDQPDKEYPEISYTFVSHVIEGLMGFQPDAPGGSFLTVSRLPEEVAEVRATGIPLGTHRINVEHVGRFKSEATHLSGGGSLKWNACFYGKHAKIRVNGEQRCAEATEINGVKASFVSIALDSGQAVSAEVSEDAK